MFCVGKVAGKRRWFRFEPVLSSSEVCSLELAARHQTQLYGFRTTTTTTTAEIRLDSVVAMPKPMDGQQRPVKKHVMQWCFAEIGTARELKKPARPWLQWHHLVTHWLKKNNWTETLWDTPVHRGWLIDVDRC